jgi:hypothetical protein
VLNRTWESFDDSMISQCDAWQAIQDWAKARGEPEHKTEEAYITQVPGTAPPFTTLSGAAISTVPVAPTNPHRLSSNARPAQNPQLSLF